MKTSVHTTQAGFSLTELMIAVALGLLLVVGVLKLFSGSKQNFNVQQGVSRAQENGRLGLYLIGRTARHAGLYRNSQLTKIEARKIFASPNLAVQGTEGASGAPDTLIIRFQGQEDQTLLDCAGIVADCRSNTACAADPVNSPIMYTNTFSLSTVNSDTGVRSLRCTRDIPSASPAVSGDSQDLIEGISDFQVEYAIDNSGDGIADRFVTATNVTNWDNVKAIRVTLKTNSVDAVGANSTGSANSDNQRVTQTYVETIFLRNVSAFGSL